MPLADPISAAWNTVARFDDYDSAQRAVDRLSDDGFPVEKLDIVGSGLRLVERVTGRLTSSRAATAGALSGLWAGLLFGILLGLFTSGHSFLAVAATGAALGVLWGAAFGFVAHARTNVGAMAVPRYPAATAPVEIRIIVAPTRRARRTWMAEPIATPTPQLVSIAA